MEVLAVVPAMHYFGVSASDTQILLSSSYTGCFRCKTHAVGMNTYLTVNTRMRKVLLLNLRLLNPDSYKFLLLLFWKRFRTGHDQCAVPLGITQGKPVGGRQCGVCWQGATAAVGAPRSTSDHSHVLPHVVCQAPVLPEPVLSICLRPRASASEFLFFFFFYNRNLFTDILYLVRYCSYACFPFFEYSVL